MEWVNAHGAEQPVYGPATFQLRLAILGEKPGETLIQVGGARTEGGRVVTHYLDGVLVTVEPHDMASMRAESGTATRASDPNASSTSSSSSSSSSRSNSSSSSSSSSRPNSRPSFSSSSSRRSSSGSGTSSQRSHSTGSEGAPERRRSQPLQVVRAKDLPTPQHRRSRSRSPRAERGSRKASGADRGNHKSREQAMQRQRQSEPTREAPWPQTIAVTVGGTVDVKVDTRNLRPGDELFTVGYKINLGEYKVRTSWEGRSRKHSFVSDREAILQVNGMAEGEQKLLVCSRDNWECKKLVFKASAQTTAR